MRVEPATSRSPTRRSTYCTIQYVTADVISLNNFYEVKFRYSVSQKIALENLTVILSNLDRYKQINIKFSTYSAGV